MSSPHPTISAWERDEHEGHYEADLFGWQLKVSWTPNKGATRGSFHWVAEQGADVHRSEHHFEEMELAMADAEHFAQRKSKQATSAIAEANS